ncbi:MAG: glycoside hydrolase family 5 protein, partial [Pseudobutyrivibrio sp.]|nr:glycoside hydrolase family 5 protein [Pseudobutyrivibrio sp.]
DDWLHTKGGRIYDKQGHEVYLTGANWFGFNCSEKVFHGLWSANMKDVGEGMADHGINLVRVPISTELLLEWKAGKKVKVNVNTYANPELKNADGSDMDSREIFDTFVKLCKENGIKIMMDCHSADANNSGHNYNVWYGPKGFTTEDWITGWTWFANEYKNDDTIIACDLKNEPHGKYSQADSNAAKWDDSKDENNWQYAASRCGKAILDVNPNLLIMVEGIEETPRPGYDYNSGTQDPNATEDELKYYGGWWGGNLRNAGKYPVDLGKYQSQLVYSPHDYGPAVYKQTWFDKDFTEQTLLDDVWYDSWFYLQDQEIAPLLIGEWGGFMDGGDNEKYLNLMSDFIAKNKINHTFWCINPNSGDTGGLLEGDWVTWDTAKYNMMKQTLWSDSKTGKFVGLDHEVPLGSNGETVTTYYK